MAPSTCGETSELSYQRRTTLCARNQQCCQREDVPMSIAS